jgi:hypothetical protein
MVADDQARGGHASEQLPAPPASKITPDSLEEFRRKLSTGAEEVVDPKTWSGSLPNQRGTAPMLRVGRSRWFNLLWLVPIGFALLVIGVAGRARTSGAACGTGVRRKAGASPVAHTKQLS